MATVERRHREQAVSAVFPHCDINGESMVAHWVRTGLGPDPSGPCLRVAQAFADAEKPDHAPVTGDRLLASLACHIDHDEPPGLAARELATELLGLVEGLSSLQVVMLSAHVRELTAKFKPGQPGEVTST